MVDCCKHSKKHKKCTRKKDKKTFKLPRKFSKKSCFKGKIKGYSKKSSCAPYKYCKRSQKGGLTQKKKSRKKEKAFFAGGCFWGIEKQFSKLKGVLQTSVGYMGGHTHNPTYEMVLTGKTDHSETVMIKYDPTQISYLKLLEKFFQLHNPLSLDKQGNDTGRQYRAIVFYKTKKEKDMIHQFMKQYSEKHKISEKNIQTKVLKKKRYYLAEDYHQKYNFQKKCDHLKTENKEVFDTICKKNKTKAEHKYTGKYNHPSYLKGEKKGTYHCSCCNSKLYSSKDAFDSGSGWPAFSKGFKNAILFTDSTKELRCRSCGLHLGHRFTTDKSKTGLHDCINSVCLHFVSSNRSQKGGLTKKKQFLYNPDDPKKSFDVYIDKNPKDTIPIKYKEVKDVIHTIKKLERLYKQGKYPHKRIWQVGMIMKVRLEVLKKKKPKQFQLANKYFKHLGERSKIKDKDKKKETLLRKRFTFKI